MYMTQEHKVIIYSKAHCPYCAKAKLLFAEKEVKYEEIDITNDHASREIMIEKAFGRTTVPQIFIDDKHIGGCDDLYELNATGELSNLLN